MAFFPAILVAMALAGTALGQSPSVATDHFNHLPGEPIIASFKGGPGNAKVWIGIYPDGV